MYAYKRNKNHEEGREIYFFQYKHLLKIVKQVRGRNLGTTNDIRYCK